MSNIFH
ncbi:hypothetical protein YPPY113_3787, partial [Yersinia pestis PY-113]